MPGTPIDPAYLAARAAQGILTPAQVALAQTLPKASQPTVSSTPVSSNPYAGAFSPLTYTPTSFTGAPIAGTFDFNFYAGSVAGLRSWNEAPLTAGERADLSIGFAPEKVSRAPMLLRLGGNVRRSVAPTRGRRYGWRI